MKKIRLSKSTISKEDKNAVLNVLNKEYLGMGEEVRIFEDNIKSYLKTDMEVICVNTGTAALHLAMTSAGIGQADEVLVPSVTYVASFQAISATGAKPVACDIRCDTLFIDIKDAKKRITSRTKAIMPVHYASDSKHIDEVYALAKKHNLRVIEDAAHAFGCTRNGKMIGQEGDILCFSFDGIKNITCGEGGAILSSDPYIIQRAEDGRLLGVEHDTEKRYAGQRSWELDVKYQGYRYHMSNIMAAIGISQLKRMDQIRKKRQEIANCYLNLLRDIKQIEFLDLNYSEIIPHIFVIKITNGKRDALRQYLIENNIECGIHYYPNHLLTKYQPNYKLPATEKIYNQILSIPCQLNLDFEQQNYVIEKIKEFFNV